MTSTVAAPISSPQRVNKCSLSPHSYRHMLAFDFIHSLYFYLSHSTLDKMKSQRSLHFNLFDGWEGLPGIPCMGDPF